MPLSFPSIRGWAMMAAGGLVAALAIAARPVLTWSDARLAAHLANRVRTADDEAGGNFIRGILPQSAEGIYNLVESAASPRHNIAHAAQVRLTEWVNSTQQGLLGHLPVSMATGRLAFALADGLAQRMDQLGPTSTEWAERLGRHLLEMISIVPEPLRLEFIEDCGIVLGAHKNDRSHLGAPLPVPADRMARRAEPVPLRQSASDGMVRLAMQPGPLPRATFRLETENARLVGAEPNDIDRSGTPLRSDSTSGMLPVAAVPKEEEKGPEEGVRPQGEATANAPALAWQEARQLPYARLAPQSSVVAELIDLPSPDETAHTEQQLLHSPLAEVIQAFNSPDRFESASAEAALRKRGMSQIDLHYAGRLADADSTMRLQLLETIAHAPGAHLVAWLHYFSEDPSTDVRLRALTLLATSRDADLLQQVRARAIQDEDPRIRALGERLTARTQY